MVNDWFVVRDGLEGAARFPSLARSRHISAAELVLLLTCGVAAAAAVAYVRLRLRIPGHSIVLAALPMAFGLSVAPRRLAGSLMSAGALGTAWLLSAAGGASYGSGSFVSLSLIGLGHVATGAIVCRHQLFFDSRVPYTSQNGSASIQLPEGDRIPGAELIAMVREEMQALFVEGSDPGLAVAKGATAEMLAFAASAKTALVGQNEARMVAERSGCHLEGLGGTGQGIIGALAAIALAASGDDGRIVHVEKWPWPDPFSGVRCVAAIRGRGVTDIRTRSGETFEGDIVDVGEHLRSWRGSRMVLFVESGPKPEAAWRALRLD